MTPLLILCEKRGEDPALRPTPLQSRLEPICERTDLHGRENNNDLSFLSPPSLYCFLHRTLPTCYLLLATKLLWVKITPSFKSSYTGIEVTILSDLDSCIEFKRRQRCQNFYKMLWMQWKKKVSTKHCTKVFLNLLQKAWSHWKKLPKKIRHQSNNAGHRAGFCTRPFFLFQELWHKQSRTVNAHPLS